MLNVFLFSFLLPFSHPFPSRTSTQITHHFQQLPHHFLFQFSFTMKKINATTLFVLELMFLVLCKTYVVPGRGYILSPPSCLKTKNNLQKTHVAQFLKHLNDQCFLLSFKNETLFEVLLYFVVQSFLLPSTFYLLPSINNCNMALQDWRACGFHPESFHHRRCDCLHPLYLSLLYAVLYSTTSLKLRSPPNMSNALPIVKSIFP